MVFEREIRILREADVRAALGMAACIDACERAFAQYSGGGAETPDVISLGVPEHQGSVHVKAGHLHTQPYLAVKVASGFPNNIELGLPANDGLVMVFDAVTGAPAAFLLDNGFITDLRTGAAGGVAARHLAKEQVWNVAVIGSGAQARYQLDALALVRPGFRRVRLWGRSPERAAAAVADLRERPGLPEGCEFEVAEDVHAAVEDADVVITCTATRAPLVRGEWLSEGVHITAVGADEQDKQELETAVIARADILAVDSRKQCAAFGELHHALSAGLVKESKAVELGQICLGAEKGRTAGHQLTVCDLTGVGVQDVAAANVVMANAEGLGEVVRI